MKLEPQTKIILISGHPRSGTTLLERICNSHPDISITHEFGNFFYLDVPYYKHCICISSRLNWNKSSPILLERNYGRFPFRRGLRLYHNFIFSIRYLYHIKKKSKKIVTIDSIKAALKGLFPSKKIVGDKRPHYIFHIDAIPRRRDIRHLTIYRDCRDVVSSNLVRARTFWKGQLAEQYGRTDRIVGSWLRAVDMMQGNMDRMHAIRYEDLIYKPDKTLRNMAQYLGVDADIFNRRIVSPASVGKHKRNLPLKDLEIIIETAGPVMKKLDYL